MDLYLRAFLIWVLIAFLEVLYGILRAKLIAPKFGDLRSRQIGVISGSLIFFAVALVSFDWIGIESAEQALRAGGLWACCMVVFELLVGRFVFHLSMKSMLDDFNVCKGRILFLGMLLLALSPYLVGKMRDLW